MVVGPPSGPPLGTSMAPGNGCVTTLFPVTTGVPTMGPWVSVDGRFGGPVYAIDG